MENESSTRLPAYIQVANQIRDDSIRLGDWIRSAIKPLIGIGIFFLALSMVAWWLRLQIGYGLFYGYITISFGFLCWACYTAFLMIRDDMRLAKDPTYPIQHGTELRYLVFGKLASACFGVITTASIGFLEPSFSFLKPDLPAMGVSAEGPKIFAHRARERASKAELDPEEIGLTKQEGIQSVGLTPETKATNWSTGLDEKAEQVMLYRYFVRVFKDREGFNPKIYWDKSQWSIGFGSNATQLHKSNPKLAVSRDEAYDMAMTELAQFKGKAKADFPWLSYEQLWAITDQYYNAGGASIVGHKGVRASGTMLPIMKRYQNNPNSISYDQLYSAMVEAKDCSDCSHGRKCGHQLRAKYRAYLFLAKRSSADWAKFKNIHDEIVATNKIAGL
jgi:hypothetical protein